MDQARSPSPPIPLPTNGPSSSPPSHSPNTNFSQTLRQRQQSSSPSASSTSSVGSGTSSGGSTTSSSTHHQTHSLSPSPSKSQNGHGTLLGLAHGPLFPPSGVLTPPTDTDPEDNHLSTKNLQRDKGPPKGRLAFYKEGVLCLELSHWDESEGDDGTAEPGTKPATKTKWSKLDGRVGNRNLVRVTKEVRIPPSGLPLPVHNPTQSPNPRSNPNQSLPNQITPAQARPHSSHTRKSNNVKREEEDIGSGGHGHSHGHGLPKKSTASSEQYLFYMRPGACVRTLRSDCPKPQGQKRSNNLRTYSRRNSRPYFHQPKSNILCLCTDSKSQTKINRRKQGSRLRPTLSKILENLPLPSTVSARPKNTNPKPRKRASKELQLIQSPPMTTSIPDPTRSSPLSDPPISTLRPKIRNSGSKNACVSPRKASSTILCVPGRGGPSRGMQTQAQNRSSPTASIPLPMFYGCEPPSDPTSNQDSPTEDSDDEHGSGSTLDTLTPEEQQQFQQQAMSKAISYTINNLLGKNQLGSGTGIHAQSKINQSGSIFGIPASIPESDQTSFLRHLLDTSDPIPSTTNITNSPTQVSLTPGPKPQQSNSQSLNPLKYPSPSQVVTNTKKVGTFLSGPPACGSPPVMATTPRPAHAHSFNHNHVPSSPYRPVFTSPRNCAPGIKMEYQPGSLTGNYEAEYEVEDELESGVLDLSSRGTARLCIKSEPQGLNQTQSQDDQDFPLNLSKKARSN